MNRSRIVLLRAYDDSNHVARHCAVSHTHEVPKNRIEEFSNFSLDVRRIVSSISAEPLDSESMNPRIPAGNLETPFYPNNSHEDDNIQIGEMQDGCKEDTEALTAPIFFRRKTVKQIESSMTLVN